MTHPPGPGSDPMPGPQAGEPPLDSTADEDSPLIAPYGSWDSPLGAEQVARGTHVTAACFVGDEIWYSERLPDQDGRTSIQRHRRDGTVGTVLGGRWNVYSLVHEYGGGAWTVHETAHGPVLYFVHLDDQRLYRLPPGAEGSGSGEPEPLTPPSGGLVRYGDLTITGGTLWAVEETHVKAHRVAGAHGEPHDPAAAVSRRLVALTAEGMRPVVEGTHFLAWPRVCPDGSRLAWIGWDHPSMPWDGTRLYTVRIADDGSGPRAQGDPLVLAGSDTESVLQPEWASSRRLMFSSDRSGYWNLYAVDPELAEARAGLVPELIEVLTPPRDIGGPLWALGSRWYGFAGRGGAVLAESRDGTSQLHWLSPSGEARELETPFDSLVLADVHPGGRHALVVGAGRRMLTGLYVLDLLSGDAEAVRLHSPEAAVEAGYLPEPYEETFADPETGREVHAVVYPPRNPRYRGRPGELPPYLALVHGGPTAQATLGLHLHHAFFTSRGIGVVDVNYGGSSGYGREYRERLRGQWGVVDVADTVTAVQGLVSQGLADPERLLISGGSAGGWTVLSALTSTDVFAAGASYYGVAELSAFVTETHDFESRYIDGLVGPLPQARDLYERRAPLNNLQRLATPVIVFQGMRDPIVPPSQAERLCAGLEEAGVPYAYLTFENESHGFQRPASIVESLQAELAFYGRVLGFETPWNHRIRLRGRGR